MLTIKISEATAARRRIPVYLVDATDGYTPETGVTAPTVEVSKAGAAQASGGGTWAEIGDGQYYYEATAAEVDTLGFLALSVRKTGCRDVAALVQIVAFDPYDTIRLGLTALPNVAQGDAGQIATGDASGRPTVAALVDNAITALAMADGAITAAKIAADAITAAKIATGAIDADALATDAVAEIADGVLDEALSGHQTAGTAGKALSDAGGGGGGSVTVNLLYSGEYTLQAEDQFPSGMVELFVGSTPRLYLHLRNSQGGRINLSAHTVEATLTDRTGTVVSAVSCTAESTVLGIVYVDVPSAWTSAARQGAQMTATLDGASIITCGPLPVTVRAL